MVLKIILILLMCYASTGYSAHTYQEKCDENKNVTTTLANGVSTTEIIKDSCDSAQFLSCQNSRCACRDPGNQIFQKKKVKLDESSAPSRSKRSPKKKGKKISVGKAAVVGVAAGVGAYQVNKGIDYLASGSRPTYGIQHKEKKVDRYIIKDGCYSRVGAACALNPDQVKIITNTTIVNETKTEVVKHVNYRTEVSECVQNAECKPRSKISPGEDANLGECVCRDGYIPTKTDVCVKSKVSGAESYHRIEQTGIWMLLSAFIFVYTV